MYKFISLSIILFVSHSLLAQPKLKTKTNTNKENFYKEVYQVLKSDQKIKHGTYKMETLRGRTLEEGQYENDKKAGTWTFYNYKGAVEQKYNYSTGKLEFSLPAEVETVYYVLKEGKYQLITVDSPPILIGGKSRLFRSTGSRLNYPRDATRMGISGEVQVSVMVNREGQQLDETISRGIGGGCDEEALRMLKLVPDEWIPARLNGEAIAVTFNIEVVFQLIDR